MNVAAEVISALEQHRAIQAVRLVGSRQRGDATELSDWDFVIDAGDFETVARGLPELVSCLRPLAQQWDRLSEHQTYMLILRGAVKVDLLFLDQRHEPEPPWEISAGTLNAADHHFWDWILWLAAKHSAGKRYLVRQEFAKMSGHILRPMGLKHVPETVEEAVSLYVSARRELEERLDVTVSDEVEREVRRGLRAAGYDV